LAFVSNPCLKSFIGPSLSTLNPYVRLIRAYRPKYHDWRKAKQPAVDRVILSKTTIKLAQFVYN